ncbi:sigma-54 dependent DNA-binding response regulator [Marinomonas sp. MED121]|uniref:sigma-54-dependent transcriptional regulator n=1 Tax=Marinomonas sp. MED121 TaxID=314277 RepID=UPI0000690C12|nr:sigma-54 dependent transcriptional regulator [Marinomonas sp. MED121]EAQ64911.1 sigma-54 dependent DNA-binding response regulator [Marinomonas sp. MED121]
MSNNIYPNFGILLVDDEDSFLRSLSMTLKRRGGINHLYQCNDSRKVLSMLEQHPIELVLLDLNMPNVMGMSLLEQILESHPNVSVIIISGMNQIEIAMQCIRLGALDYFVKTTDENHLIEGIKRTIRTIEMRFENHSLRSRFFNDTLEHPEVFETILTQDKNMRSIFQYLEAIAASNQPIMINGESGVGKELIAQAIHKLSNKSGPIISVNVAGLDDNMFSDTLFGHSRGAFSGAEKARAGMIEQANGGTLFLDEIGDLSLMSQVKLLRLLQEGEYYPLGSDHPKRLNARVVVATHQDLTQKQEAGEFRKDLYYRLQTHQVSIPPLRQRHGDIAILLDLFLEEAATELNKTKPAIPKELPVLLSNYAFPGNVRELRALAFKAMGLHRSKMLSMDSFKELISPKDLSQAWSDDTEEQTCISFNPEQSLPSLTEVGDLLIDEAMQRAKGNQSIASRLIGISQPALSKRIKKANNTAD